MGTLDGKAALVTGGSRGIGLAIAKRFVTEGAHVIITGRNQHRLEQAATEIGDAITPVQGDVANLDDLGRLHTTIADTVGHLDIVIANAAIGSAIPFPDVTPEQFDAVFNTDARGVFFTVQKALPLLREDSSVVLITSGLYVKGQPASSVYSAAKATLRSFARTWTTDLKDLIRLWWTGFGTNVLNPKALLFFVVVLLRFIEPGAVIGRPPAVR